MTWLCKNCGKPNIFWKNTCSRCGEPQPGYKATEPDVLEYAEYILKDLPVPTSPQPVLRLPNDCHGFGAPVDCTCPPYGTCMNTACPRAWKVTS
jgi:hypothetical protein